MPLDAIFVTALAPELEALLRGSRIDKIYMPARDEAHIAAHGPSGNFRLLVNGGTVHPRVHATAFPRENPSSPPMFCMLLRKHLSGGRFAGLFQPPMERVLRLSWDCSDEMGGVSRKSLVCEMMGRHSNLILVDAEERIIDCLRRVDSDMSEKRPVLPGLFYRYPPKQEKTNPLNVGRDEFPVMLGRKPPEKSAADWLIETFDGLSPVVCRHLASEPALLEERFFELCGRVSRGDFSPCLLIENGEAKDFCALPVSNGAVRPWDGSLSELLDGFYTGKDHEARLRQRVSAMMKTALSNRERLLRKAALQQAELAAARDRERLREQGDLLMANLHRVTRGAPVVTVTDFYSADQAETTIPLDPSRTPQQNAARFYKAYAKAKNAETVLSAQIEAALRDAEYWDSVAEQLSRVTGERDIEEIRDELSPQHRGTRKPQKLGRPHEFRSSEGVRFYAGRNNRQNDLLTLKTAAKNDMWLHAQKIPGCHVVIECGGEPVGERTLVEAASVAAYFSRARAGTKVPVDYTQVKNVKKPPGVKPGMVIYDRFSTILAEPDESLVLNLKVF